MPAIQGRSLASLRDLSSELIFIALVLGVPFGIATTPFVFRDGDTSWQIAAGEWIMRHAAIPRADPFSYTAAGHPWVAMEWLAELIYAAAFRSAGFAGVATIVAAALIAVHAIIFFYLERRVSRPMVAATLVMMDLVVTPFVMARPHLLSWPLIAGWTVLLLTAAEKGRPPPLWSVLILVVWTNLHASFPIALAIAGAIGLDALIAARWSTLRQWAFFGVASLIAVSLNANGVAGLLQPFRTSALGMLPLIGEWHRSTPHATPFFFAVFLLALVVLLWSRAHIPIGRSLLLLGLAVMALAHVRHQSLFAIVAACILPPLWQPKASPAQVPKWLLLGSLPLLAFRAVAPLNLPESEANPTALIAAIPPQLRTQPVFNSYIFGGPLILAGIRPYVDGRAEIYGDAFVTDYVNISSGNIAAFDRTVRRYGISWAIIRNSDSRLIRGMESSGAWHRIYGDSVGVIEVRGTPADGSRD
ncbi:MAG TPA: hypothetical protein VFW39_01090 [Sphingomicrobium sp.]|nr:hypothetical protein [Sphingomicrobium sp.]